jgi:hypothetical protein
MEPDLRFLLDAFARSANYYRSGAGIFTAGALIALGGGALLWSDPPRALCAALLAALFAAIALGSRALARRYTDEDRSPVLRALLHAREQIANVAPRRIAANPRGLGITGREQHFVSIKLRDGSALGVRVQRHEVPLVLDALARLAPSARVDGRTDSP